MGKGNIAVKEWISVKERFADLFNGVVFQGKQIVLPEELEKVSGESDIIVTDKKGNEKGIQRYRDVTMRWKQGAELTILACENQKKIHYAMPVRTMLYDSLTYTEQIKQIEKSHKDKEKITSEEFLSRFRKDDKLFPVISLVFYYGLEIWDGNRDIYDMFYLSDILREQDVVKHYIPNYHINLVDVGNVGDLKRFRTDLQVIFGMLQCRNQKTELRQYIEQHKDYFSEVDLETYQAIRELLHSKKKLKTEIEGKNGKEVKVDMCKALEDIYEEGREEGREEGTEEGIRILVGTYREFKVTKEEAAAGITEKYSLPLEEAKEYVEKYWEQ